MRDDKNWPRMRCLIDLLKHFKKISYFSLAAFLVVFQRFWSMPVRAAQDQLVAEPVLTDTV